MASRPSPRTYAARWLAELLGIGFVAAALAAVAQSDVWAFAFVFVGWAVSAVRLFDHVAGYVGEYTRYREAADGSAVDDRSTDAADGPSA